MSHPTDTGHVARSPYDRGYLVGRAAAAGWSDRSLRRAIAVRIQGGRTGSEVEWGIIDAMADILISHGEASAPPLSSC